MQYIRTTSPAVESTRYRPYSTRGSEKRGRSKKDPRPQLRYRVLVKGAGDEIDKAMRLTEGEMKFLSNKKEKLEEYWAGHSISAPFLLSLLAARGPESNKGVWNQLPGDQGAALELLESKQMADEWVPGMQGLEAVITTAQDDGNRRSLSQTGQSVEKARKDARIDPLAPLVHQISTNLSSHSPTPPLSPYSQEYSRIYMPLRNRRSLTTAGANVVKQDSTRVSSRETLTRKRITALSPFSHRLFELGQLQIRHPGFFQNSHHNATAGPSHTKPVSDSLIQIPPSPRKRITSLAPPSPEQSNISHFDWYSFINDDNSEIQHGERRAMKETPNDTFDNAAPQAVRAQQPVQMRRSTPAYLWIEL
ncbi:hypothetical protein FFLO_06960 [Filobasidium floriforme]|uniref:Uncharacterized protein n=1 Tax=Filobasidium floriforme TaxID=5210 RepID=A0A8K0JEE3_9TREE|nr:uncharacterized protein HD553DRAFT_322908 [Filobasidium floriforme]KAG7527412.1 hypothetical protein FFLO_06960 [Filobasidium floriforme]KAH8087433.1 hypothetical protein HD553DRAFT_322908 [Filobasidium floriforme]